MLVFSNEVMIDGYPQHPRHSIVLRYVVASTYYSLCQKMVLFHWKEDHFQALRIAPITGDEYNRANLARTRVEF
jgi:hypothetical protein